jgi:8-oxo-dGTP pyrophosphatase MutT (NUDIX family)
MKLPFTLPDDGKVHEYCMVCYAEGVQTFKKPDEVEFHCPACGATRPRRIYNGATKHWTTSDGTWWHESAGVFVRSQEGTFLFFELTAFPYGVTVPAGHVDKGEEPAVAAARELKEEVGIASKELRHIGSLDIPGDSCSGGCDDHHWHIYLEAGHPGGAVNVVEEGKNPVWLTLDEAVGKNLPVPIRAIVKKYRARLQAT